MAARSPHRGSKRLKSMLAEIRLRRLERMEAELEASMTWDAPFVRQMLEDFEHIKRFVDDRLRFMVAMNEGRWP